MKLLECPHCRYRTLSPADLQRHVDREHAGAITRRDDVSFNTMLMMATALLIAGAVLYCLGGL